jgi:hypothetical protein
VPFVVAVTDEVECAVVELIEEVVMVEFEE